MEPRDPSPIPRPTKPGLAEVRGLAVLTFLLGFQAADGPVSKAERDWRPVQAAALVTAGAAALCVTRVRRRDRGRA